MRSSLSCGPAAPGATCQLNSRPGRRFTITSADSGCAVCGSTYSLPCDMRSASASAAIRSRRGRSWMRKASRPSRSPRAAVAPTGTSASRVASAISRSIHSGYRSRSRSPPRTRTIRSARGACWPDWRTSRPTAAEDPGGRGVHEPEMCALVPALRRLGERDRGTQSGCGGLRGTAAAVGGAQLSATHRLRTEDTDERGADRGRVHLPAPPAARKAWITNDQTRSQGRHNQRLSAPSRQPRVTA